MPRGDGTGPAGLGQMTGRAAGYCAGYTVPGYANDIPGRGGGGRGRGGRGRGRRGRRNMFWATGLPGWMRSGDAPAQGVVPGYTPEATQEQQKRFLENELQFLRSQMEHIQRQLDAASDQEEASE
ncbi:DUF5320 domain-containing protein [Candidatus Hydrogenedentota bacterium]